MIKKLILSLILILGSNQVLAAGAFGSTSVGGSSGGLDTTGGTMTGDILFSGATNGACFEDPDQCIDSDGAGGYQFLDEAGNVILTLSTAGLLTLTGGVTAPVGTWNLTGDVSVTLGGGVNGINFDSNTLSIDGANDRVGIGTAAPSAALEISKTAAQGYPVFKMVQSDLSANYKIWSQAVVSDTLYFQAVTDDSSVGLEWLSVKRVNAVPSVITFYTNLVVTPIERLVISDDGVAVRQGNLNVTTNVARVGGIIETNATPVGNVDTGTDDLMTFSVGAASLNADMQTVSFRAWGSFAGNANVKTLTAAFGGTTLITSGAIAANTGSWIMESTCMRTGAATQTCTASLLTSNALLPSTTTVSAPTETLSGAVTLKLTGTATTTNDIVQSGWQVRWDPAN